VARLPTGTVTFLFTDIESSTRLLDSLGDDTYDAVLAKHDRILRDLMAEHSGAEVRSEGDGFFMAFADAGNAVAMALEAQIALGNVEWPHNGEVRVRMGLHTGPGRLGGDNYIGMAVHQATRICSAAQGGQVVVSEETRQAAEPPPAGAAWRSLGRHRLKNMGGPLELFQLCHPSVQADFPPLRSLERVTHNLPIQMSSFLGRHHELAVATKLLRTTRLLSVIGPGGTGKTRLAYQLAAEELHKFTDGVVVVEMASVADASLVPASLMAALGIRSEPGRTETETAVSYLRRRQTLIVLDNCEHLIDAAAALVTALLGGCEQIRIVATSREPLRVGGESVWGLGPLTLPETGEPSLEDLAGVDAIALFCERAAEARVGFALSQDNSADVTAICMRLEGIPLAIELAAARVRSLTLTQIADRLSQSLDLLTKGARGAGDRQASLRGAISWSYDLLTETEQTLYRRLAVFAGSFTLQAAEAVCADEVIASGEVVDILDSLVDKSLVVLTEERAGEGRYRLLDTIRSFASELLRVSNEEVPLAARHAEYYAELPHITAGDDDSFSNLDRIGADHLNLVAALDHFFNTDAASRHAILAADLFSYWDLRGHWPLASREFQRALEAAEHDRDLRVRCALGLGTMYLRLGRYPEAETCLTDARRDARELGDRLGESLCLGELGHVASRQGNYAEARTRFEESLGIARELGDQRHEGEWIGELGTVALDLDDYPTARTRFEESLGIARELGDQRQAGWWSGQLGGVSYRIGDYEEARRLFTEALAVARQLGDRRAEAFWCGGLGATMAAFGDIAESQAGLVAALRISRELGDRWGECGWLGDLGDNELVVGDYPEAQAHFDEALVIARELGDVRQVGWWVGGLGKVASEQGDYAQAREHFEEARTIACEIGERGAEYEMEVFLGKVALDTGDHAAAAAHFNLAFQIGRDITGRDDQLVEASAQLLSRINRCHDAAQLLGVAERLSAGAREPWPASDRARFGDTLSDCRSQLGEAALKAEMARGSSLADDAVIDLALEFLARGTAEAVSRKRVELST